MTTATPTRAAQLELLTTAYNRCAGWTEAEIEFLRETKDIPAVEVAAALERSLFGVYNAREALAKETLGGSVRRAHDRRQAVTRVHHDRAVCVGCGLATCGCDD